MKQITANSVGTIWRSDVIHAADGHQTVEVLDLDGKRIALVEKHLDSKGRGTFYVDGRLVSYNALWSQMHTWSDIIVAQNTRNYQARMV